MRTPSRPPSRLARVALGLSLLSPSLAADELPAQLERIFSKREFQAKTFDPARWRDGGRAYTTVEPSEAVPDGLAVVGAALKPGEYPTSSLRAGDRVRLIKTTPTDGIGEGTEVAEMGVATVWTVEPLLGSSQLDLFVSLLVSDLDSADVAEVVAQDQLRLVLIGAGS